MTRPVRVLHIIDSLDGGGSERWVWDIVRMSDPSVVRHRVVTIFPEDRPFAYAERLRAAGAYSEIHPKRSGAGGRRVSSAVRNVLASLYDAMPARVRLRPSLMYAGASWRILREWCRFRPDVIHGHIYHGFRPGVWLKALTGRPFVYTQPSLRAQMIDAGAAWLPDQYRRLHRWIDAFFIATEYKHELTDLGIPDEKMYPFVGTVDVAAAEPVREAARTHRQEIRQRLGLPVEALIALSVGRMDRSKGHRYALQALPLLLDRFPNLHWVVLGQGEERAALEQMAVQSGVDGHVHLVGFVDNPRPFYAAADVYLRTPVFEGENSSSQDAMAFGLPVVGFDTGCALDFVRPVGHGLLVRNKDANALAGAIAQMLSLPDRGRAIGARGLEYCRRHLDARLSVEIFTERYLALHDEQSAGAGWKERAWVRS